MRRGILQRDQRQTMMLAGVAHEINNPLGIMLHGIEIILRRTSADNSSNIEVAEKLGIEIESVHRYLTERKIFQYLDLLKDVLRVDQIF